MLDPNSKTRITARQVAAVLLDRCWGFYIWMKLNSCVSCRDFEGTRNPNLPMHSVFHSYMFDDGLNLEMDYDEILSEQVAPTWEAAKKLWLQFHMWW